MESASNSWWKWKLNQESKNRQNIVHFKYNEPHWILWHWDQTSTARWIRYVTDNASIDQLHRNSLMLVSSYQFYSHFFLLINIFTNCIFYHHVLRTNNSCPRVTFKNRKSTKDVTLNCRGSQIDTPSIKVPDNTWQYLNQLSRATYRGNLGGYLMCDLQHCNLLSFKL